MMVSREALKDNYIGDLKVTKGSFVTCMFAAPHINEKFYENPYTFNPDRWNDPKQKEIIKNNPMCFVPFSGGPRNCIGQHLAMIEAKIILALFLRNFSFDIIKGYEFKMAFSGIYTPLNPVVFDIENK